MNTAKYVDELIAAGKAAGENLQSLAWRAGKACEGWPYVYGAWGAECTPSERRKRLRYHPEKTEISKKCQVLNGSSLSCPGCKWYPNNERVRCFDCRGFTDWLLNRVYDFDLYGDSVGVQWRTAKNWADKGAINTMPKDTLVCLFVYKEKDQKFTHTGFGINDETIECSSGVQVKKRDSRWTHWALPKCVTENPQPGPAPTPEPAPVQRKTLRKGDKGAEVRLMQNDLLKAGEALPRFGADGDFGNETLAAVKSFQKKHGLIVDGICGKNTWAELKKYEKE